MAFEAQVNILRDLHEKRFEQAKPFSEYLAIVESKDEVLGRFTESFKNVTGLTKEEFRDFLSFNYNCHWTGLERATGNVCDAMPVLIEALERLFDEEMPIANRMDRAISTIEGLSSGILSAVLLVRYPDRYSVWNGKSMSALKCLKLWPESFPRRATKGQKYEQINAVIQTVATQLKLDLWSLDGLWHVVNGASISENNLAFENAEQIERQYFEGGFKEFSGLRTERDAKARDACLKKLGYDCTICGFNFVDAYGEIGFGFIHVHHREDLAIRLAFNFPRVGKKFHDSSKSDVVCKSASLEK